MVNTIDHTVVADGPRNYVHKLSITGDGSGEETATALIDTSSLSGTPTRLRLKRAEWDFDAFVVSVFWDAATDDELITMSQQGSYDGSRYGGILDPQSTTFTGDIVFTTLGLGDSETGTAVLEFVKVA